MSSHKQTRVILLKNKTVPIDKYESECKCKAFEPVFIPLIKHTHVIEDFKGVLDSIPNYLETINYIIITSQRTVESLNESIIPTLTSQQKSTLFSKTVYTVGPATADFIKRSGFLDIRGGKDAGNGSVLADMIINDLTTDTVAQPPNELLFLVGEIRRDIIPKKLFGKGIKVREVVTYKTEDLDDNFVRFKNVVKSDDEDERSLNWVVVFSPQGTKEITQYLSVKGHLSNARIRIASIGPTTKKYLDDNNIASDVVSPKPDPKSLLDAIESYKRQ
ncbi:uroporphyrinogen-III synthase HEM4 [Saccharomyces eubayanus]|uniref:uroporphyrinogen-III synthase HEM4 n=1 Tax=Saccharomyces eubayanus TaxID=1080349 RepID=UPI0006C302A6|nr:HEM4-like protein [Saccharomyces eubayanus]KOG96758.1 HEM4-like protein [Saccharomyces eubayanus]